MIPRVSLKRDSVGGRGEEGEEERKKEVVVRNFLSDLETTDCGGGGYSSAPPPVYPRVAANLTRHQIIDLYTR